MMMLERMSMTKSRKGGQIREQNNRHYIYLFICYNYYLNAQPIYYLRVCMCDFVRNIMNALH